MNFKIDTREKFTIITPESDFSSANLTAELKEIAGSLLQQKINLIISLKKVFTLQENIVEELAALQQRFYEGNISFVICEVQPEIKQLIKKLELEDTLNIIPSETEAWDVVQMEEIERELMSDD